MTQNNKQIIKIALGTTFILGLSQSAFSLKTTEEIKEIAKAQKAAGREKCAGRILTGLNDCLLAFMLVQEWLMRMLILKSLSGCHKEHVKNW